MTLIKRSSKGSALSYDEMDGNFEYLHSGPGKIIEMLTGTCDGRTVVGVSGSYTWPNGTQHIPNTTFVDMNGSVISYTPPAGTNVVKYEFNFQAGYYATNAPLYHMKFLFDGTEVEHAKMSQYMYYDDRKNYVVALSLNNDTPDITDGRIGTWNTAKEMKIQIRSYTASYRPDVNSTNYWLGPSSGVERQHVKPTLTITAIG